MHVVVVGAGEADAKLGETQGAVVAPFFGADVAHIGNRETEAVAALGCAVIVGGKVVVHQIERSGEFVAAINAHSCRIDADSGHVTAHGTQGIAHAEGLGRALVEGLRKQAGIVGALREGCRHAEKGEDYGEDAFHNKKTTLQMGLHR